MVRLTEDMRYQREKKITKTIEARDIRSGKPKKKIQFICVYHCIQRATRLITENNHDGIDMNTSKEVSVTRSVKLRICELR